MQNVRDVDQFADRQVHGAGFHRLYVTKADVQVVRQVLLRSAAFATKFGNASSDVADDLVRLQGPHPQGCPAIPFLVIRTPHFVYSQVRVLAAFVGAPSTGAAGRPEGADDEGATNGRAVGVGGQMSHRVWYPDGQVYGPYPIEQLQQYLANGTIPPGSQIETANGWVPVEQWGSHAGPPQRGHVAPTQQQTSKAPRAWGLGFVVWAVPLAWLIVHNAVLSTDGAPWLFLLWTVAWLIAMSVVVGKNREQRRAALIGILDPRGIKGKITVGFMGLLAVYTTVVGFIGKQRDGRIDDALALADNDPCAIERLAESDGENAGFMQDNRIREARKKCDEAKGATLVLEQHKERTAAYVESCRRLERALAESQPLVLSEYGGLQPYDVDMDLLVRVKKRELVLEDLALTFEQLPCSNDLTRDGPPNPFPAVREQFLAALRHSKGAWTNVTRVSEDSLAALENEGLEGEVAEAFRANTERNARAAAKDLTLSSENLFLPIKQCMIAKAVGAFPKEACAALAMVHDRTVKTEERARDRAATRELRADEQRHAQCDRLTEACLQRCAGVSGEEGDICLGRCMPPECIADMMERAGISP